MVRACNGRGSYSSSWLYHLFLLLWLRLFCNFIFTDDLLLLFWNFSVFLSSNGNILCNVLTNLRTKVLFALCCSSRFLLYFFFFVDLGLHSISVAPFNFTIRSILEVLHILGLLLNLDFLLLDHLLKFFTLVGASASIASCFNGSLYHRILGLSNNSADPMTCLLLFLSLNILILWWLWVWNNRDSLVLCSIRLVAQILGLFNLRDSGSSFKITLGKLIRISNPFSLGGQSLYFYLRNFCQNGLRILNSYHGRSLFITSL